VTTSDLLDVRPASDCTYDLVSLGEVMLRLDPGEGRIRTTRTFTAWEGGGEYNVARALRRCFGLRTAVITALVDNEVGRLVEDLMLQGGLDTSHVRWVDDDGIGRAARNGLNFTERGFGVRAPIGVSDRGHTAVSQLCPDDIDWDHLFGVEGVRWFHTGGIFSSLGERTADVVETAMASARRHGTITSFDFNHRPSLWKAAGGPPVARDVNRRLMDLVDVLFASDADFTLGLGFDTPGRHDPETSSNESRFEAMTGGVAATFPGLRVIATTRRAVVSASRNDWGAVAWADGQFHHAIGRPGLEILDRIGGGDGFASGLIYALLNRMAPSVAVEYGAAHGALTMTTAGDTSMATLAEVESLVANDGAHVRR
jgi:2-dehydro-3-deoxygluconokinase